MNSATFVKVNGLWQTLPNQARETDPSSTGIDTLRIFGPVRLKGLKLRRRTTHSESGNVDHQGLGSRPFLQWNWGFGKMRCLVHRCSWTDQTHNRAILSSPRY